MTSSPKPSRKLLAVASALSVVAGSMTMIPASFAANGNSSLPAASSAQNSNDECRHFSVSGYPVSGSARPVPAGLRTGYLYPVHFLLLRPSSDPDRRFGLLECLLRTEPCIGLPVPDRGLHPSREPPNPR